MLCFHVSGSYTGKPLDQESGRWGSSSGDSRGFGDGSAWAQIVPFTLTSTVTEEKILNLPDFLFP